MYNIYSNFKLSKNKDLVEICADEICSLENKDDDFVFEYKRPRCLMEIVNKKLSLFNLRKYYILTLKVSMPNRLTDYKKIWGLAGFAKHGIYDGSYDCADGRIYFGVYEGNLPQFNNDQVNIILLCLPYDLKYSFNDVIRILAKNVFGSSQSEQELLKTLQCLQKTINQSIVVFEIPKQAKVYVLGRGVENGISCTDLPKSEIIES